MTPSDPSASKHRATNGGRDPQRRAVWHDLDQSAVMTVELVVAVLFYGGLGLLADRWLGTGPWLMGVGTLVGFGAGLYLVWLRANRLGDQPEASGRAGRH